MAEVLLSSRLLREASAVERLRRLGCGCRRQRGAKHYREIPSKRKKGYMRRFPDRFSKTRNYLKIVRVFTSIERCLARARETLPSATVPRAGAAPPHKGSFALADPW
jgi:hypothetical protein